MLMQSFIQSFVCLVNRQFDNWNKILNIRRVLEKLVNSYGTRENRISISRGEAKKKKFSTYLLFKKEHSECTLWDCVQCLNSEILVYVWRLQFLLFTLPTYKIIYYYLYTKTYFVQVAFLSLYIRHTRSVN